MDAPTADSPSPAETPVRVLLSYSWDSKEHGARVLALAQRLRGEGIDAWLDQFTPFPSEGWPRWMEREIEKAQFVIVIATAKYAERFGGDAPKGTGLGATWEGGIITQELYEASGRNEKFLPAVIAASDLAHIPSPLRRYRHFPLDTEIGYERLYRLLTGQPEAEPSPLGKKRNLPVAGRVTLAPLPMPIVHTPVANPKLHQLPPAPESFVGREEDLRKLRALNPTSGALLTGLGGMGGIGKTALALVLAHEWAPSFPDAQLLLDGRGTKENPPSASKLIEQVIQFFEPTAKLPEDPRELQAIYHEMLKHKRVLLLLDDAHDAPQAQPLIPPAGCAYLVTSRRNFMLGRVAPHQVGRLSEDQAIALLRESYPALSNVDSAALAKLCAGLPLALRLAGAHLALDAAARGGRPNVNGYLESLRGGRLATLDADAIDAGEIAVSETLRLSEAQLPEADRDRWRKLGVFTTSFDARAAQAIAGADEVFLARLLHRHLLEADGQDRYKLHDLTAEYVRKAHHGDAWIDLNYAHARHFRDVGREADAMYLQGGADVLRGLEFFDRERANLETAFDWLATRTESAAATALIELVNAVAYTLSLRFHPLQRVRWLVAQGKAARLVGDRPNEGVALGNLGLAYADLGETRKAIESCEQHLLIAREIGDRRGEGTALNNLGIAYAHLGETRKAIGFYEQDLLIAREIGDRRGEGMTLGNLGNAYAALGETRKAIDFHEQRLLIAREIGDRRGEGNALGNLGNAYADLGETRKAIEFYEQHLLIAREIGDRRTEGSALGNLGIAYAHLDETRKAIEFYEQYLLIAHETGDRRGEGNALGNLGNAYADLGETRKATGFYEQQLLIARKIGDRRGEGNALWNSALALERLGNRTEAVSYAETAAQIYETIEDRNATQVREQLAKWRVETGESGASAEHKS